MTKPSRRELLTSAAGMMAATALGARAQVHASESPVPHTTEAPQHEMPQEPVPPASLGPQNPLSVSRAIPYDQQPARTMANGGESRDILHGTLATGETVNLHQSSQPAGAAPNPLHVIHHTEFILVREGTLEFQHEDSAGRTVKEQVGPGGVLLVANGTRHTVRNAGDGTARYFVVAIGGDAK